MSGSRFQAFWHGEFYFAFWRPERDSSWSAIYRWCLHFAWWEIRRWKKEPR